MKPYGQRDKLKVNLPDNHPSKGYINWWEVEMDNGDNRKRARRQGKKQIKQQLVDHEGTKED